MIFKDKITHIVCIVAMLLVVPPILVVQVGNVPSNGMYEQTAGVHFKKRSSVPIENAVEVQELCRASEIFALRLFSALAQEKSVISPFAIQTSLTMARMGAVGQTALQIDEIFGLFAQNPKHLANNYQNLLATYHNNPMVQMANKMYAMRGYTVKDEFNKMLSERFYSSLEPLDFANNVSAAQAINSWVEEKTNSSIRNLVNSSSLSAATRLVLINAIHFNGNWFHQFPVEATQTEDFHLDDTITTKVQMMNVQAYFNFAVLANLKATALEMPFRDSDISMLVILPDKRSNLVDMKRKLKRIQLAYISKRMTKMKINVYLPKFKDEFQTDLTRPLAKMGMERMFSSSAEFNNMLEENGDFYVSLVLHKAVIEVNERGTDPSATTYPAVDNFYINPSVLFKANRPFCYIIKDKRNLVLYEGVFK